MKWEEFLDKNIDSYNGQIQTNIECPKCGRKIYYDSTIILTSYPCKYYYWCSCGWSDSAPQRWVNGE